VQEMLGTKDLSNYFEWFFGTSKGTPTASGRSPVPRGPVTRPGTRSRAVPAVSGVPCATRPYVVAGFGYLHHCVRDLALRLAMRGEVGRRRRQAGPESFGPCRYG
jgi:hypothetical protein